QHDFQGVGRKRCAKGRQGVTREALVRVHGEIPLALARFRMSGLMIKRPHAAPSACCPPRGLFCLGSGPAAKKIPPRCAFGLLPPEGAFLPWERPGGQKNSPTLHLRLATPGDFLRWE